MKGKDKVLALVVVLAALSVLFIPLHTEDHPDGSRSVSGLLVLSRTSGYAINASVTDPPGRDRIGISLDYTGLDFGYVPLGSRVTRYLDLDVQEPVKVHLSVNGGISGFVTFDRNDFILSGPERVPVTFNADETGNFSGTVEITSKRPRYGWLSWTMEWI